MGIEQVAGNQCATTKERITRPGPRVNILRTGPGSQSGDRVTRRSAMVAEPSGLTAGRVTRLTDQLKGFEFDPFNKDVALSEVGSVGRHFQSDASQAALDHVDSLARTRFEGRTLAEETERRFAPQAPALENRTQRMAGATPREYELSRLAVERQVLDDLSNGLSDTGSKLDRAAVGYAGVVNDTMVRANVIPSDRTGNF